MVKLFLQFKADVNAVTETRRTPLHYAAQKGHLEIIGILLEHFADVSATETKLKETPLHRAAVGGTAECIKLLLKYKADLHALNLDRRTPLHRASMAGNIDTLTCLITNGSATGLKDKHGKTAFECVTNITTRAAFEKALREKKEPQKQKKIGKEKKSKKIVRDDSLSKATLLEIERDNQKDILHLKSVFQAITKAVGDAGMRMNDISKRHTELIFRESEKEGDPKKLSELKDTLEIELKQLKGVLSEISQSINSSQDAMERCIFSSDANLDSTYDSTAEWEIDTIDDEHSFDKIDHITSSFSDSENKDISPGRTKEKKEPRLVRRAQTTDTDTFQVVSKVTAPVSRKVSEPPPVGKQISKDTKIKRKKHVEKLSTEDKKKRMKRSKSAKKMKISHATAPLKRQSSDAKLKTELSQLDKEQLIEMALKLKEEETESDSETPKSGTATFAPDNHGSGMGKKLKHRIPSKTRLRIAPLG